MSIQVVKRKKRMRYRNAAYLVFRAAFAIFLGKVNAPTYVAVPVSQLAVARSIVVVASAGAQQNTQSTAQQMRAYEVSLEFRCRARWLVFTLRILDCSTFALISHPD